MARSPYDRLLGNPPQEETQGETALFAPAPTVQSLFPTMPVAAGASPAAASTMPGEVPATIPGKFLTINEFFGSSQYQNALLPEKMDMEKAYRKEFLNPDAMEATGATAKQRDAALNLFNQKKAKVEKDGMLDWDLLDKAAYGLASAAGGVARVFGFDDFADKAKADADRIERENFSNATRFKGDQAWYEQKKLEARYGGEDNIPWWEEVKNGLSNFARQPIDKTVEALGSSVPALAASLGLAASAAPAAVGVPVMALVGALMASGDSAEGAYQKIMGMTEQQLSASPEYTELRQSGAGHELARKTVADRAVREAAMLAAPIGAVTGAVGARHGAEAMIMRGAAARGFMKNAAAEAAGEAVEEGGTQATSNRAVQRADPSQGLMTGVAGAATEGALASGGMTAMGGAIRAIGGQSPQETPPDPAAPVVDPNAPAPQDTELTNEELAGAPAPAAPNPNAPMVDQSITAAAITNGEALPARIASDPGVQELQAAIDDMDPASMDPNEAVRLSTELTARIAFVQASDAVNAAGGDAAMTLADMTPKAIRDRYLKDFKGQLWTEPVRNAFMSQAREARRQRLEQMPPAEDIPDFKVAPPAPAPAATAPVAAPTTPAATPAAPQPGPFPKLDGIKTTGKPEAIGFGVAQKLDDIEFDRKSTLDDRQAAAAVKEVVLAVATSGGDVRQEIPGRTFDTLATKYGVSTDLSSLAGSRATAMLRQIGGQFAPQETTPAPTPAAATPTPAPPAPAPTRAVPAQRDDVQAPVIRDQTVSDLVDDTVKNWTAPKRQSRAAKNFDERSLTDPILPAERASLNSGKPVEALLSIAKRYAGTTTGEFAADLARSTVGSDVKTKAGSERLKAIIARYTPAGGPRGTIAFGQGPVTVHAALHEFAHALTVQAIKNPVTQRQKAAVRELTRIMKWVGANLPANSNVRNGITVQRVFTDPAEFAAEVYANPMLQNYLKSVPSSNVLPDQRRTGKSLWDFFLDGVAKLMKIRRTALYDTLYTLREIDDGSLSHQARVRAEQAGEVTPTGGNGQNESQPREASGAEISPTNVDSGQDNPVVPSVGASPGASAGAVGPATGDPAIEAAVTGTTGANAVVTDLASKVLDTIPEPSQAEILAAAALMGTSPERLTAAVARNGKARGLKKKNPALDKALDDATGRMDQFAQMSLRRKARTALENAANGTSAIRTYDDMMQALTTGEMPTINRFSRLWGEIRERYVDSATPFLRLLGWNQNLNLWKTYKRAGAKLQEENKILNEQLQDINNAVNQFAKQLGLPVSEAFAYADRYATARYVAKGANEELAIRNAEALQIAQTALSSARGRMTVLMASNPNSTQLNGLRGKVNELRKQILRLQQWQDDYARLNDLVRGRDQDANGNDTEVLPDHRFIAGMTRQEGIEAVSAVTQRFGPSMPAVDAIADRILGLHRFWADRALQNQIFFAPEAAQWSQNRFKGKSGDYYVPVAGNDNLQDQEDIYSIGGTNFHDYSEEGRATIGDGAYLSVVHYASGMAQRIAHREFMGELYANAAQGNHGMFAVAYSDPTPNNKRTFLYKEQTQGGRVVVHKIALNDDKAADSLVGANRYQMESSIMKGVGSLTSTLGFLVTQGTMMFGPINMFRDFGEKVYTMMSKYTDVPSATFVARATAEFANITGNFMAAWRYAMSDHSGQSQADKDLRELAHMGGLNTRTGSINREADKIISAIKKQNTGFKQAGQLKEWIGRYNEAFEMHASLAIYRALKATTKNGLDETAFRLLDSMNFSQSGSKAPALRALYLFFNPTVQGARNTYESLIKGLASKGPEGNRKRAVAFATLSAAVLLYGLSRAMGGDDDDYGNRTDSLATNTVSRNIPIWLGGDRYLRIPIPFGAPAVLWNMAVAASRFATGTFTAQEALAHMMQSTAEHTVPFPISQVDAAEDPAFWAAKTFIPQIVSPLVNVLADKNDFGSKLSAEYHSRDKPNYIQGRRGTPQQWKDIAEFMAKNGLGDYAPEAVREMSRVALVGPLGSISDWALGTEQKEGEMHYFGKALGMNRLYTEDPRGLIRSFYDAENRDTKAYNRVYYSAGDPPKDLRGEARLAGLRAWINSSDLSPTEQELAYLPTKYDKRMRDARRGKSGESEQDVMRAYLRERRTITGD